MLLHVERVTLKEGYELQIQFSDGVVKDVDLSSELYGEVFEPLREPGIFSKVKVGEETHTIEWPNGTDFAPEFLYEIGRKWSPSPERRHDLRPKPFEQMIPCHIEEESERTYTDH